METPAGPRDTVGLPLKLLPGFLFGISTGSISDPEIRAKVLTYKRECHAVLYSHFFGKPESADDPTEGWDWEGIGNKLGLVREARLQHGRKVSAALWLSLGLPMPDEDKPEVLGSSAIGLDYVRQFLSECTAEQPGGRVQSTVLFEQFQSWSREAGDVPPMTHTGFALTLTKLGVRKVNYTGRKFYIGIRIRHRLEVGSE